MSKTPRSPHPTHRPTVPWTGSTTDQARFSRGQFLLHLRPGRVPVASLRWRRTMGLGGSALVMLLLILLTGTLQLLVYQPSLDGAFSSVQGLESSIPFGDLIRGIHYWSANALLLIIGLHLLRVVLTGAFGDIRRTNWMIGLGLLSLVLAASFTGYLLPLDQRAWWAVTVSTHMLDLVPIVGSGLRRIALGAQSIEEITLVRFAAFHTAILPVLLAGLVGWHFWRVRRAGGIATPEENTGESEAASGAATTRVAFFPHLFVRELGQASLLVAAIFLLAAIFGAPLGDPANPGLSPNPVKAPWYFVGSQELLIHVHPLLALVVLPGLTLAAALALPRLAPAQAGVWFYSRTGRSTALTAAAMALVITPALILLSNSLALARSGWLSGTLLPLAVLAFCLVVGGLVLRRLYRPARTELALAAVSAVIVAHVVLTLTGQFLRGADMALVWPWLWPW